MAKARAIVKRRKSVRNIRKITKTMQMIATAKFQKALKRAVGTKPYTLKVRDLVREVATAMGKFEHPLLRRPSDEDRTDHVALIVITSNRGLAGGYNGNVLRAAVQFIQEQEAQGKTIDLFISGKKAVAFFNFRKRAIAKRYDQFADQPRYADVDVVADDFIQQFTSAKIDGMYVAYMDFISTATQKARVLPLLPLASLREALEHIERQSMEKSTQAQAGAADMTHTGQDVQVGLTPLHAETTYDFSPSPRELMDELLPLTVKTALFQCFLDAIASENVARMVAMKSATDNADKIIKALTMQYNRARQSQITTELSEIMGGVEAMKA
jgi:F-type H+-transporting ATPase subunit gamma